MNQANRVPLLLIAGLSLLFSSSLLAASIKRVEHSIDADDLDRIDIEVSVAEMDIEIHDGNTIELDITLEANDGWWIFGRKDIDDVELSISNRGNRLVLILDEDDVEQDWRVRLPAHLAIDLEIGVGDVDIDGLANDLILEMGVGSVQVDVADMDFSSIHLQTGVGDSSLRGFGRGTDNERNFVGADSFYQGDGEYQISVEVGVGEARVRRR